MDGYCIDKEGYIRGRFINIVHVYDIFVSTLNNETSNILTHSNLNIQNFQSQEYYNSSLCK